MANSFSKRGFDWGGAGKGGGTGQRVQMPGTKGMLNFGVKMPKRPGGYAAGSGVTGEERFASEEAQRERDYSAQQDRLRFQRGRTLMKDVLGMFESGDGGGGGGGSADSSGSLGTPGAELEASIRRAGKKRASQAEGILAQRGIYKSGASAATAATIQGETEAQVAGTRASLAESAAERKNKRSIAALQARTQLASSTLNYL